jgi:hypothetical protein
MIYLYIFLQFPFIANLSGSIEPESMALIQSSGKVRIESNSIDGSPTMNRWEKAVILTKLDLVDMLTSISTPRWIEPPSRIVRRQLEWILKIVPGIGYGSVECQRHEFDLWTARHDDL